MILVDRADRIVTLNWSAINPRDPDPYLVITSMRPHEDPAKVDVKTIRLALEDAEKLTEFVGKMLAVRQERVENEQKERERGS